MVTACSDARQRLGCSVAPSQQLDALYSACNRELRSSILGIRTCTFWHPASRWAHSVLAAAAPQYAAAKAASDI